MDDHQLKEALTSLRRRSPAAHDLVRLLSFFAPTDLPVELLVNARDYLSRRLRVTFGKPARIERALEALARSGLADPRPAAICMQDHVQTTIRRSLTKATHDRYVRLAVTVLDTGTTPRQGPVGLVPRLIARLATSVVPPQGPDTQSLLLPGLYVPHALHCASQADRHGMANAATTSVLTRAAGYLEERGQLDEARAALEQAVRIDEGFYGTHHALVAERLNALCHVLSQLGDATTLIDHTRRVLAIRQITHGLDHSETAICHYNVAIALANGWAFEEALAHIRVALATGWAAGTTGSEALAAFHFNHGAILAGLGQLQAARDEFLAAVTAYEAAPSRDLEALGDALGRIADVSFRLDDLEGARHFGEWALRVAEQRQTAGTTDSETLAALHAHHGAILECLGQLQAARDEFLAAVTAYEAAPSADLEALGDALDRIASISFRLDDLESSRHFGEWALRVTEQRPDADDGTAWSTLLDLGRTVALLGEHGSARRHAGRALAAAPEGLEFELRTHSGVGLVLLAAEDFEDARGHFARALEIAERVHGPDHIDTETQVNNLARAHFELGNLDEAWALHQRALRMATGAHGDEHLSVALQLAGLADVMAARGEKEEARAQFERALAMALDTAGEEEWYTQRIRKRLAKLDE